MTTTSPSENTPYSHILWLHDLWTIYSNVGAIDQVFACLPMANPFDWHGA